MFQTWFCLSCEAFSAELGLVVVSLRRTCSSQSCYLIPVTAPILGRISLVAQIKQRVMYQHQRRSELVNPANNEERSQGRCRKRFRCQKVKGYRTLSRWPPASELCSFKSVGSSAIRFDLFVSSESANTFVTTLTPLQVSNGWSIFRLAPARVKFRTNEF